MELILNKFNEIVLIVISSISSTLVHLTVIPLHKDFLQLIEFRILINFYGCGTELI